MPVGVSASSLGLTAPQKGPLPVGVYIIAVFSLIGVVESFLNNSNSLYSLAMVIDLLIVCGLFLRLEVARVTSVVLQAITLILTVLVVIMLAALQARINQLDTNYHQAVSRINPATETPKQKAEIDNISGQLESQKKQVAKNIHAAYISYGITIAADVLIIWYLTRPKVKEAFH